MSEMFTIWLTLIRELSIVWIVGACEIMILTERSYNLKSYGCSRWSKQNHKSKVLDATYIAKGINEQEVSDSRRMDRRSSKERVANNILREASLVVVMAGGLAYEPWFWGNYSAL